MHLLLSIPIEWFDSDQFALLFATTIMLPLISAGCTNGTGIPIAKHHLNGTKGLVRLDHQVQSDRVKFEAAIVSRRLVTSSRRVVYC